jgi:hypothetical protein
MNDRRYKQGVVSLGFNNGPSVVFRLNPNNVEWNFQINTNVTETVGGRVVQVLGATLSDVVVKGSFGEHRNQPNKNTGATHIESWETAETFLVKMKAMAAWQSRDSTRHNMLMHQPAIFNFAPKNWRFAVYIKDLTDPDGGGSITHRVGKFSYDFVLTMSIHADLTDTSHILGKSNGVIDTIKDAAIESYVGRIADGIGWKFSKYNGRGVAAAVTSNATTTTVKTGRYAGKTMPR